MMTKRELGKTGLSIAPLCFGAMEMRRCNAHEAKELLNTALDAGINYIDTCPEYETSEYYIGQYLSRRRDEFILATKCGDNVYDENAPLYKFDRETCTKNLEDSLRLLKTDCVDVWQLHGLTHTALADGRNDDALRCMEDAKKAGKARFLGTTIRNGRPGEEGHPAGFGFNSLLELTSWGVFDVIQLVYGGMTRTAEDRIYEAAKRGTAVLARGVQRRYFDWYGPALEKSGIRELLEPGESFSDFLIRYALSHRGLSGVVVGTASPAHLRENVAAAERGPLPDDVLATARERLTKAGFLVG